ncbi:MAG TPA: hypothetical protein PLO25_02840 [Candidatus Saccharibacteria bacterium]|nr:hypothetical protein [Candidatus Saccharibacteria bacterium]
MKPEMLQPNIGLEQKTIETTVIQSVERTSDKPSFKEGIQQNSEKFEQNYENSVPTTSFSNIVATLPEPVINDENTIIDNDDTPLIANDDDLIEKDWVDKAKKIVAETKEDPYRQEESISKLQVDYIKKRYGRKLGSDDSV